MNVSKICILAADRSSNLRLFGVLIFSVFSRKLLSGVEILWYIGIRVVWGTKVAIADTHSKP